MSDFNPWDRLSSYFDTDKPEAEIESNAADNIYIAWPVVLKFLKDSGWPQTATETLDFGCGTGQFVYELSKQSRQILGVDTSASMIKAAKNLYGQGIHVEQGSAQSLAGVNVHRFDAIVSLMVLQFVKDAAGTIYHLASLLKPGGLLIFTVFTPEYVHNAYAAKKEFFNFKSGPDQEAYTMELVNDVTVPTFIRASDWYKRVAQSSNLELILEDRPPFTPEFLKRYPHPVPTKDPEYLILGFRKTAVS